MRPIVPCCICAGLLFLHTVPSLFNCSCCFVSTNLWIPGPPMQRKSVMTFIIDRIFKMHVVYPVSIVDSISSTSHKLRHLIPIHLQKFQHVHLLYNVVALARGGINNLNYTLYRMQSLRVLGLRESHDRHTISPASFQHDTRQQIFTPVGANFAKPSNLAWNNECKDKGICIASSNAPQQDDWRNSFVIS